MRIFDVLVRDDDQPLLARADFVHTALVIKPLDCGVYVTTRELFNDRLQVRISLADDVVKMCPASWSW